MMQAGRIAEAVGRMRGALGRPSDHRTRLTNIAHLLTGNFFASILGLTAFALSARALGLQEYGQLALMLSFTRVIERIVSFQSWQSIIKYGAGLQGPEHRDDFRALLKFGLCLDMGAALCAWGVAIALAFAISPLFGWSDETVHLLMLFSTVLLFQISGMPNAVLRLSGQFHLLAYGQLFNLLLRVVLCLIGIWMEWGILYFTLLWAGNQILGSLTMLALSVRTLRRQGVRNVLGAPLRGITRRFPGIWNFAWSSNLSLTMWVSSQELDTLLVGALADPASAGLYHIAKRIGRIGQQVGSQVQSVLYPDVARLWAKGKVAEFRRVVLQVELFLLGFGALGVVVVTLIIHPLLLWTAGPGFMAAAPLVIVQMMAVAFNLSGAAARAALLAMGRQREVLRVVLTATGAFHLTAVLLIPQIGAMGGNCAHIVLGVIWTSGLGLALHRAFKIARATGDPLVPAGPLGRARESALLASEGI